nr:probable cytochrome P450 49a1 [Cherax quadricarinatus]XP_053636019.1 probable cytochrome P450 49a1 [Cherax quadricarinatus]XP_053636070.1 probable cytochrome P450 49a1 [Cherax quadricarinatus]
MRSALSVNLMRQVLHKSVRKSGRSWCFGYFFALPYTVAATCSGLKKLSYAAGKNITKTTTNSATDIVLTKSLSQSHDQFTSSVSIGRQSREVPRPFSSIPGPRPLPLIGNKFLFTSIGGYPLERFLDSAMKLHEKYGPIVRISKLAGKLDMVMVFQPEDTKKIFQAEGQYPVRPGLDILQHYRATRPHWFSSPGLVPGNGPEWRRLRSAVHSVLRPEVVSRYREAQNQVAVDLVRYLRETCSPVHGRNDDCVVQDLLPLLYHYTLEAVGVVTLGTRLGCLEHVHTAHTARADVIIKANEDTLELLGKSFFTPPLYKVFPTRSYQRLARAQDTITRIVQEEVYLRHRERAVDPQAFATKHPLLDSLLSNPNLNPSDVFLLLVEMFQGGIDATATTLGFCVYFLAREQRIQDLLLQEVKDVDPITHSLQGLAYLRAAVQETLRLRPSASSRSRVIQEDAVFSGYLVPAGTYVTSPPVVACCDPEVFPEPEVFRPERWLSRSSATALEPAPSLDEPVTRGAGGEPSRRKVHPYTIVAFGHGARMCPGRRLAEQEIKLALIQLVKSFKMEVESSTGGDTIGQIMRLNMMPDKPFAIRFTPRNTGQ